MKYKSLLILLILYIKNIPAKSVNENEACALVDKICTEMITKMNLATTASWNHATNLTDENEKLNSEEQARFAEFLKKSASDLSIYDYKSFKNTTLKRLIKNLADIGDAKLDENDFKELKGAVLRMQATYSKVKIPSYKDKKTEVSLEPEITQILTASRDVEELKYYWVKWYDAAGTPSKADFFKYAELKNKASKLNDHKDGADAWLNVYEDETFESQIDNIVEQIKPLYMQLHGYVRHKLAEFYGPKVVDKKKSIPMHLLGNVWAQQWMVGDIVMPYKFEEADPDEELINKKYTPKKMFQDSEEFFTSLGLPAMPESFWTKSIIEKPTDGRDIVCHASAWDFAINNDVRIKQCTRVSLESYRVVHHEMGHIVYYLLYAHLPPPFRTGANPGFHEAVGDTIALSVSTPKHLHKIGLLKKINPDPKAKINQMLKMGLEKLPFLPFSYVFDKYRYGIFRGSIKPENANEEFWKMREKFGGVAPPVKRTNADFDITAKFHASADVEYLRYFVSFILQFQFHKAACIKAGEYEVNNPAKTLADCDIYKSKEAGEAFKKMLSLGASVPWNDALEVMTGERKLDASALLEYFAPLSDWLKETNKKLNAHIGW